jgi:predicted DCC family thiol-disulfide oxidoreductase YuxK
LGTAMARARRIRKAKLTKEIVQVGKRKDKMSDMMSDRKFLVLYDGVCGLCDKTVQTLLSADKKNVLSYAALQGETAAAILKRHPRLQGVDSIVYVRNPGENESVYVKSGAVLRIFGDVGGLWKLFTLFLIVPSFIRDGVYGIIASNRYRWFGKYDSCKMPSAATRSRFLP